MAMPNNLVLVRHGESELNVINRADKAGQPLEEINREELHDWQYHLSPKGIEQARAAGKWLTEHFIEPKNFDKRYTSAFARTRETAAYLGGMACTWLPDDRLRERDWGIYGIVPFNERAERFPETEALRSRNTLFAGLDNGESMAGTVLLRWRDWLDTLHRDASDKNAIVVTHGEMMWVARFDIENMLPEEWDALEQDDSQKIRNCSIIWYSRVNPDNPDDISRYIRWRRMIYPDNPQESPFGGEWVELPGKRELTGAELLDSTKDIPYLLGRD